MADDLTGKLADAEALLPGIAKKLEPYSYATWGMHWNGHIEDIVAAETEHYNVVAAKWDEHEWSEDGGGIAWNGWISYHFAPKDGGELRSGKTGKVNTRHQYNADLDRRSLWPCTRVKATPLHEDTIELAWADPEGRTALRYEVDLVKEAQR